MATVEIIEEGGAGFGGGVEMFEDESDTPDPWTGAENESLTENDQESIKITAEMNWDTGIGSVSLIPSYSTRDGENGMVMMGDVQYAMQESEENGVELRVTSPSDFPFKWILGGTYYYSEDTNNRVSQEYLDTGVGSWSIRTMTQKNKALFANITYPITEEFRLTAGYRKSWDNLNSDNVEVRESMADPDTYEEAIENMDQGTDNPDYKIGFEYDLADNWMIYADYSTSYRVNGMSMTSTDPEKLKAYSLGSKSRFLDNKLQVNASAYYYDYTNFQASNMIQVWLEDPNDNLTQDPGEGTTDSGASTVGDGRIMGLEIKTTAVITSKDLLNLSVSYINSEWTDLYFDYEYDYTLTVVNGELVPDYYSDDDYNGKPMSNTPDWTLNLSYSHSFTLWNGGNLKVSITSKYQTEYRLSWKDSDYPNNYQEAFHMENVNLTYNHPGGTWSLSAYCNNINDYAEKTMYMSGGGGGSLSIGNPRTFGAVLSVKF